MLVYGRISTAGWGKSFRVSAAPNVADEEIATARTELNHWFVSEHDLRKFRDGVTCRKEP